MDKPRRPERGAQAKHMHANSSAGAKKHPPTTPVKTKAVPEKQVENQGGNVQQIQQTSPFNKLVPGNCTIEIVALTMQTLARSVQNASVLNEGSQPREAKSRP
eukprot:TRINITY_DN9718_c0_g1_i1.p2 TRINITY_DN9718_c0_g1~~TRINITY_DN9718_c0_g1_i1.p2  ORF type:complete len:103 (+),score=9.96 TRINITY_DN9718_c0_g1_i1:163-471(+)